MPRPPPTTGPRTSGSSTATAPGPPTGWSMSAAAPASSPPSSRAWCPGARCSASTRTPPWWRRPGGTTCPISRSCRRRPRSCYEAVRTVLRPGGVFHAESAGAGNVPRLIAVLDDVAAGLGRPPARVTLLTPSAAFELLEEAGFTPGPEDVRALAQRRPMTRAALLAMVRTQAVHAWEPPDPEVRSRFLDEATARLDELRRPDGSYDQTF